MMQRQLYFLAHVDCEVLCVVGMLNADYLCTYVRLQLIIISERYKKFEHTLALASAAKFSVNLAQSLSEQVRGNPPQEFTGKLKWGPVN